MGAALLQRLRAWFEAQCDGEWEHHRGISIQSTDNPGWWVKIDVVGTALEGKPFAPVQRGGARTMDPQPPWLHCFLEEGVFNGAGDPTTLEEILEIFLEWTEGHGTPTCPPVP
jgi:hypothetical protein